MLTSAVRGYDSSCHSVHVLQLSFSSTFLSTIGSSSHSPPSASLTHHPYTVTSRPSLHSIIVASVVFEGRLVSPLPRGDTFRCFPFIEPGIFASVCRHNSLFIYGRSLRTSTLNWFATVSHTVYRRKCRSLAVLEWRSRGTLYSPTERKAT